MTFLRERKFSRPHVKFAPFARNQIKIKSSVDKAFWDNTKSFLQYKAASVELKRGKTPVKLFFQSPRRWPPPPPNYAPRGKTVTAAYIHKALWFGVVFGLKGPRMSVQNFFFARPSDKLPSPPLFSIIGSRKRRQDVPPAWLLPYFTPATFYFFLKVKSELANCLLTQGTLKKKV